MNYLLVFLFLVIPNFMSAGEEFFDFVGKGLERIEKSFDKNFPSCKPYKKYIFSGIAVALVGTPLLYFSRSYFLNSNSISISKSQPGSKMFGKGEKNKLKNFENKSIKDTTFSSSISFDGSKNFENVVVNGNLKVKGSASIFGLSNNVNNIKTANTISVGGSGEIDSIIADAVEISGFCDMKNSKINQNILVKGSLSSRNVECAGRIDVKGSSEFDSIIADVIEIGGSCDMKDGKINKNIFIGGSLTCKNVQCEEKIELKGFCDFDKVSTKIVYVNLMGRKVINPDHDFLKFNNVQIGTLSVESDVEITVYISGDSQIKEIKFFKKQGKIIYQ